MTLQEQIKHDMKTAMKAKESGKVTTLRGVMSAFTNELVSKGQMPQDPLSDDDALAVIKREAKKRKDAIQQFTDAGRPELAEGEQTELAILDAYLPELMSIDQIKPIVQDVLTGMGDNPNMGQAMGAVMAKIGGAADGNDVRAVVQELLA